MSLAQKATIRKSEACEKEGRLDNRNNLQCDIQILSHSVLNGTKNRVSYLLNVRKIIYVRRLN
jgi:hypothetical protein